MYKMLSSLARLDLTNEENMLLFVRSSEAVESNLVKLETSGTMILPPQVIALCKDYSYKFGNQCT